MIYIQINMELTGFEDNIFNYMKLAEQEVELREALKKVRENKKKLENHLIVDLESKHSKGVKFNGKSIEIKCTRRKDKLYKTLKVLT
jgi:hypothetical protein